MTRTEWKISRYQAWLLRRNPSIWIAELTARFFNWLYAKFGDAGFTEDHSWVRYECQHCCPTDLTYCGKCRENDNE